jgi:hypothetical protein
MDYNCTISNIESVNFTLSGTGTPNPVAPGGTLTLGSVSVASGSTYSILQAYRSGAFGLEGPGTKAIPVSGSISIAGTNTIQGAVAVPIGATVDVTITDPTPLDPASGDEWISPNTFTLAGEDTTWTASAAGITDFSADEAMNSLTITLTFPAMTITDDCTPVFPPPTFEAVAVATPPGPTAGPGVSIRGGAGFFWAQAPGTMNGWEFTTTGEVTVIRLGYYDHEGDGLTRSHEVGIWDSAGGLVVSATVPSGTTGTLISDFRYVDIAPTILAAGTTYIIGGHTTGGVDLLIRLAPIVEAPFRVNYLTGRMEEFSNFTFPTVSGGFSSDGIFGPNFYFVATTAVPTLGTWPTALLAVLLAASALAWIPSWNRRPTRRCT